MVWDKYYTLDRLPVQSSDFRGSFWWKDLLKLLNQFKGLAVVSLQDGKTCTLWHDMWTNGICSQQFPELLSLAKNAVYVAFNTASLHDFFTYLCLKRPMHSSWSYLTWLMGCSCSNQMINGHTYGAHLSSAQAEPIDVWLVIIRFTSPLNGYGAHPVRIRGKSSGWFSGIDLIPETCFDDGICTYQIIPVFCAIAV